MRLFNLLGSRTPEDRDFLSLTTHEAERAALARAASACNTDCPRIDYPNVIDARELFGGSDVTPKDLGAIAISEQPISHVRIIGPFPPECAAKDNSSA